MKGLNDVSNEDVGIVLARILIRKGLIKEEDLTLDKANSTDAL
jgi:hypothetical protein